jgi:chromosome segregation ATPase
MLEDNVNRLEHEIANYEQRFADADTRALQKAAAMKTKIDELIAEKAELEGRVVRLEQSLDAVSAQAKALQASNQQFQSNLGVSAAKQSAAQTEVHTKVGQLSAQLKRATQEKELQAKQNEELQSKLAALRAEADAARAALDAARVETDKLTKEKEMFNSRQQETLSSVEAASTKYEEQLRQTQQLLKVVQAQKAELQSQNQALRSQIDESYK